MRAMLLSLIAVFASVLVADEVKDSAPQAQAQAQTPAQALATAAIAPADPDVKLKDDIVGFEREKFFQDDAVDIEDPFIYVYRQPEDAAERAARKAKLAQDLLTLKVKSIIVAPESELDSVNKRYTAQINDMWVKECRVVNKKQECDEIVGWKVVSITKDKVTLRVDKYKDLGDRDLVVIPERVAIKVTEFNDK